METNQLIIFFSAFLVYAVFLLDDLPVVILFHLVQSVLKFLLNLTLVIFAQGFDCCLEFSEQILVIVFKSFNFALKIVDLCDVGLPFLIFIAISLHYFLLSRTEFVSQSFDVVV